MLRPLGHARTVLELWSPDAAPAKVTVVNDAGWPTQNLMKSGKRPWLRCPLINREGLLDIPPIQSSSQTGRGWSRRSHGDPRPTVGRTGVHSMEESPQVPGVGKLFARQLT